MDNVLIFGTEVTGLSTYKTLQALNILASLYDSNAKRLLKLKAQGYRVLEENDLRSELKEITSIVKSPGIPPNHDLLIEARNRGIRIISDLELLFNLFPDRKCICVTGTNGKTTTVSLLHHLLKEAGLQARLIGNIGVGMLWSAYQAGKDEYLIIEASSFQLHDSPTIKPWIAAITNLEADHLDWHGSYDRYVSDKFKVFKNQGMKDYSVINLDDPEIVFMARQIMSEKKYISLKEKTDDFFYQEGKIFYGPKFEELISTKDLKIKGVHNIQNVLIASSIARIVGLSLLDIRSALRTFDGIEHRLEFVAKINGVEFYNDSKATNPASTIKALESFENIILIAGGYDKKIDLAELFSVIKNKVKLLVLFGQTKDLFNVEAKRKKIKTVVVDDLLAAVTVAYESSQANDVILFSPASASWDMYRNFEERGEHFKSIVRELGD